MMSAVITFIVGLFQIHYVEWAVLAAIMLFGAGWGLRYWRRVYVASEKEFDQIEAADYAGIQAIALKRFELTPDDLRHAEPCKFRNTGPKRDFGHAIVGSRTGSDDKARRSPQEYLVINFGHAHLYVFRCVWDLTMGSTIIEETHEFAYRDVVCVELKHTKETIKINLDTRLLIPLWQKHGIEPINKQLQIPTDESVSLRLVQGEVMDLFAWKCSGAGVPSGAGMTSRATAQRLQKLVRELKQPGASKPTPAATPAPPKVLPTIRTLRGPSSS